MCGRSSIRGGHVLILSSEGKGFLPEVSAIGLHDRPRLKVNWRLAGVAMYVPSL